jgi:hypothetical protein
MPFVISSIFADRPQCNMADVSWNEPLDQQKIRQEQQENVFYRESLVRSSRSNSSRVLKEIDSTPIQVMSPFFGLFNNIKKKRKSLPKLAPLSISNSTVRKVPGYNPTPSIWSPSNTTKPAGSMIPARRSQDSQNHHRAISESPSDGTVHYSNYITYSYILGSIFSGWTGRSANTNSTWSASTDPSTTGRIIQPLSPDSYVTQSTEVTVSARDSVNVSDQLATVVHISAAGTMPIRIRDSGSKLQVMTLSKLTVADFLVDHPCQRRMTFQSLDHSLSISLHRRLSKKSSK